MAPRVLIVGCVMDASQLAAWERDSPMLTDALLFFAVEQNWRRCKNPTRNNLVPLYEMTDIQIYYTFSPDWISPKQVKNIYKSHSGYSWCNIIFQRLMSRSLTANTWLLMKASIPDTVTLSLCNETYLGRKNEIKYKRKTNNTNNAIVQFIKLSWIKRMS